MRIIVLTNCILFNFGAFGQDYFTLVESAEDHHVEKRYAESINFYQKAFKIANDNRYDM